MFIAWGMYFMLVLWVGGLTPRLRHAAPRMPDCQSEHDRGIAWSRIVKWQEHRGDAASVKTPSRNRRRACPTTLPRVKSARRLQSARAPPL